MAKSLLQLTGEKYFFAPIGRGIKYVTPRGSSEVIVTGRACTKPWTHIMGNKNFITIDQDVIDEIDNGELPGESEGLKNIRNRIYLGHTSSDWVLRVNLENPWLHFEIPEALLKIIPLRISDKIVARVKCPPDQLLNNSARPKWQLSGHGVPTTVNPFPPSESQGRLGEVTEIISVNELDPFNK